jgi:hypothetical protein
MNADTSKFWRLPAGTGTVRVQLARRSAPGSRTLATKQYLGQWMSDPMSRQALLEMWETASGWSWPARFTGDRTRLRCLLEECLEKSFDTRALVVTSPGKSDTSAAPTAGQGWTVRPTRGREILFKRPEQLGSDDRIQDPEKVLALLDDWLAAPATQGVVARMYADLQNLPPGKAPTSFNPATLKLIRTTLTGAIRSKKIVAVLQQGGSTVEPFIDPPVQEPPPKPKAEPKEKTWFQCQVLDEEGIPMAGERYTLVDSDGGRHEGKLDADGKVYIPPILDPGDCTIRLPDIHLNPRKRK